MNVDWDWTCGLVFGLEHLDYSDMEDMDLGYTQAIILHLGIGRIILTK